MPTSIARLVAAVLFAGLATSGVAIAQPVAPPPTTPSPAPAVLTKEACLAFIDANPAISEELTAKLRAHIDQQFWDDQQAATQKRHNDDAQLIATNKRHVVAAYIALWLLSMAFLGYLWQRQGRLVSQISELEARLKKP